MHLLCLGLITVFASTLAGPAARADCTSIVGPRSTQPGAPPKRTIYCGETPQERERAEGNPEAGLEACKADDFGELCAVMARGHQEAASRHHAAIARRRAEDSGRETAQRPPLQNAGAPQTPPGVRVWDTHPERRTRGGEVRIAPEPQAGAREPSAGDGPTP